MSNVLLFLVNRNTLHGIRPLISGNGNKAIKIHQWWCKGYIYETYPAIDQGHITIAKSS